MVAPRITKCGHLFCYSCLLQYLDFEKEHAWKKCPLCSDPVYKRDIRKATIIFDQRQKDSSSDELMQFRLVARNKSNTVAKHKVHLAHIDTCDHGQDSLTILEGQLPSVDQGEYSASRVRTGNEAYIRQILADDLVQLKRDKAEKETYGEDAEDQVYYLEEAIEFCESQLEQQEGQLTSLAGHFLYEGKVDSEGELETFVNPKQMNKMKQLQKKHSTREAVIAETSDTCFYFYQALSGENLFLHPLCLDIIQHQRRLNIEKQAASNEGAEESKATTVSAGVAAMED